uniref:Uncharacterized protein n=1 Tax=Anopheles dirus TaxID=7168 RepID=A0A182NWI4_9DIPT
MRFWLPQVGITVGTTSRCSYCFCDSPPTPSPMCLTIVCVSWRVFFTGYSALYVISCSSFMLTPSIVRDEWLFRSIVSGIAWPGTYPVHGTVTRTYSGFVRQKAQQNTRASSIRVGTRILGGWTFRSSGWITVNPTRYVRLNFHGRSITTWAVYRQWPYDPSKEVGSWGGNSQANS